MKPRSEQIIEGLKDQNAHAEFEGRQGFWCQGDAVFIEAPNPMIAVTLYRQKIAAASIGISHNHNCGSVISLKRRQFIDKMRRDPTTSESLKEAIDKDCP